MRRRRGGGGGGKTEYSFESSKFLIKKIEKLKRERNCMKKLEKRLNFKVLQEQHQKSFSSFLNLAKRIDNILTKMMNK